LLKAQPMFEVPMDQFAVEAEWAGTSGKPEHGVGEGTDLRFHQISRPFGDCFLVGEYDNFHIRMR